ncbi:MAG TPA: cold shock and DUF1294 domain-containing protein [Rhodocyclaceae bacterium]|nr:cold shock and DUF1294 domain-containing protein [Rhodocyclaceae bacterium]
MKVEGTIKIWNDDRGFGFIEPSIGGQEIFVHIKAFSGLRGRPRIGQRVAFSVATGKDGKKRAQDVELIRAVVRTPQRRYESPAQWGTASLFAIPGFVVLFATVEYIWRPPGWIALLYVTASFICFLVYAFDKSAAVAGRWRVSEGTLLALGLAGGWPGALVAQQLLRHKSSKTAFRTSFWVTVVANVAALLWFCAPVTRAGS